MFDIPGNVTSCKQTGRKNSKTPLISGKKEILG
jgi:hypothetical protein